LFRDVSVDGCIVLRMLRRRPWFLLLTATLALGLPRSVAAQSELQTMLDPTYQYAPSENLRMVIGVPSSSVEYGPFEKLTLEASYFPLRKLRARATVRYRAAEDSPEETIAGHFELPAGVYNGMLGTLMKNLAPAANVTPQIVAFTPQPRLVKLRLASQGSDEVLVGDQLLPSRFQGPLYFLGPVWRIELN
jgi:hypothetical protein